MMRHLPDDGDATARDRQITGDETPNQPGSGRQREGDGDNNAGVGDDGTRRLGTPVGPGTRQAAPARTGDAAVQHADAQGDAVADADAALIDMACP